MITRMPSALKRLHDSLCLDTRQPFLLDRDGEPIVLNVSHHTRDEYGKLARVMRSRTKATYALTAAAREWHARYRLYETRLRAWQRVVNAAL